MSQIKNGRLDQYGAEPFEQQQFGTAGVKGVKTAPDYTRISCNISRGSNVKYYRTNRPNAIGTQGCGALLHSRGITVHRGLSVRDYGIRKFKKNKKLHFEIKIKSR